MKTNKFLSEMVTSVVLVVILIVFLNPSSLLMPKSMELMLIVFLVVMFFIFAALFWKESSADERENFHRQHAGRLSYLFGTSILVLGIIVQSINHNIDPWLVYTLIAMILVKIISRVQSQIKN